VKEVFTAGGISEDQNTTINEFNLLDDGQFVCKVFCEMKKEGESCKSGYDNDCTVGFMCLQRLLHNQIISNNVLK
jgi:hypothetical protein